MAASLFSLVFRGLGGEHLVETALKEMPGGALGAMIAVMPVSYTHLRAHETVLDLVCRLLLEKKKN